MFLTDLSMAGTGAHAAHQIEAMSDAADAQTGRDQRGRASRKGGSESDQQSKAGTSDQENCCQRQRGGVPVA
jgi:hypothetical protein